jgi:hypothetical protein
MGARVVQPSITSHYSILARLRQVKGALGRSVTVIVDETLCRRISLSETFLRDFVQGNIPDLVREFEGRLRSPVGLQVNSSGVMLNLRLRVKLQGYDGDVDINTRYQVLIQDCRPNILNPAWDIDADLGVWENLWNTDDVIADNVTGILRPRLIDTFQTLFTQFVNDDTCLCRVTPLPDQLDVTICPKVMPPDPLDVSGLARV